MQRNNEQRNSAGRGAALLAATGLLTVMLAPGASAARHHVHRHARHVAHHHARHVAHHHARRYARSASGGEAYGAGIESSLAGIRMNDSYRTVLARFGNPTETQLEEIELVAAGSNGTSPLPPGPATAAGAGVMTTPVKIFVGPNSTTPGGAGGSNSGSSGQGNGLMGALQGAIGALGNGSLFQEMGGMPGQSGMPGPGGVPAGATLIKPDHPEYRWIYDEPNSNSLEFTFSPGGNVIQIRATGYQGFVHTTRGIQLGVKFSQVLLAYGNPEKQDYDGPILSADYTDRSHVGFQFYNQRLVGITVASVE